MARLLEHAASVDRAEPEWGLLVIEFRVHAARDPQLGRRYAAAHQRTLTGMEQAVTGLYQRAGHPPPLPPADLARLLVAVGVGARLEQAAEPDSFPATLLASSWPGDRGGAPPFSVRSSAGRNPMTTITDSTLPALRARFGQALASRLPVLTNLHNHTQPLIRYQLTDRFIRHPTAGDPYLRAAVEGRADEIFATVPSPSTRS